MKTMKNTNTNKLYRSRIGVRDDINKVREEKSPLVSVLIPIFNGASYLEAAVESVQKSTYKNFEILLIDDGSTDHSRKVCRDLDKKYKNVRFFAFAKNKGLGRVLNFGLKEAKGKLICRLNQDDMMLPYRMKVQVDYMKKHREVAAVGSYIRLFENDGSSQIIRFLPTHEEITGMWHIVSPFSDPSVMYRKTIALKAGGYKQKFWPADDTQLWYRIGMLGKLANIKRPLVNVRWHDKAGSVYHFRTLARSTYAMHRWAHKNVSKAPLWIQAYWLVQYGAGLVLPPQFNWRIYRLMKLVINHQVSLRGFLTKIKNPITKAVSVIPHPKKLSLSGVYSR